MAEMALALVYFQVQRLFVLLWVVIDLRSELAYSTFVCVFEELMYADKNVLKKSGT